MTHIMFRVPPFPTFIKGGEAVFAKGKKHFKRTFSVFDLLYVKKGRLYMTEEERTFAVGEGEYVILIPEREHYGHQPCMEDTHFVWLHFVVEGEYEGTEKEELGWHDIIEREATYVEPVQYRFYLPQYAKVNQKERIEQLLQQIVELNEEQAPDSPLKQQMYFIELILQLQKQALSIPSAAEKVCMDALEYIHHHYHEPLDMKQLATALRFHPDYISRCMQKTIGMSAIQYINHYRLSKAKKLLASTNETIAAIAKQVGMEDGAYFSRLFKKAEGVTPMEYRRTVQRM
ncbi:AraC family transcriptional regulator [Thermolongibacillus altinsuensis]|jgi:AraC-like DNA-binding protein|uniref:AraC family transcriptional regulator n=1 Tax=Thermolongibacillus altinsuensis TaxID=575256 RepID=A0A4R1QGI0_9BACL|nr:AraC family transcriptional regulator [Thermolongibacillus altinsuensis]TCL51062.1 AraC family transcriptional regulator [Thermolongibacillus altinsuensis]GMB08867.1 putative HTH-type transcriptional regulator YisR [Thermolongibacillus altinsuensis]